MPQLLLLISFDGMSTASDVRRQSFLLNAVLIRISC